MIQRMLKSEWCIAFRKRKKTLLFDKGGLDDKFTIISNTLRYWCADPFLIDYDGLEFLFMECYDRLKRKGVIGYRKLLENGRIGKLKIVYETVGHLSYPFIFKYGKDIFMIPESSQEKKVVILKAVRFPDTWKEIYQVKSNSRYVDTTLYIEEKNAWLFTTPILEDNKSKLEIFCYKDGNFGNAFPCPVVNDKSIARQAGKIFIYKGEKWRVSQDCKEEYGKAINFSRIISLNTTQYEEMFFCKITSDMLKLDTKRKFDGVHTYNYDSNYEVIDLKKNGVFKFMNFFGWVSSKLKGIIK